MTIQLTVPTKREMKPRIIVFGVGGAGGNAVDNMIEAGLDGVEFVVANTDAQALSRSSADRKIQMGAKLTEGLGAGSDPEIGRAAAEEALAEIVDILQGAHLAFVTAGMGGGTGTGAAAIVARAAREQGVLTVGVVTKPFDFEGKRRQDTAEIGIAALADAVDTLIVIPNQNLFRIANERTTFSEAFGMADEVLYSGVASLTDLMVRPGRINLDFADVRSVMADMGTAMMGSGEAEGEDRAKIAAEAAIANPLLDEVSMANARGVLVCISGGADITLYEYEEAANRIREEVSPETNIIVGTTIDESLEGVMCVSVVATGVTSAAIPAPLRVVETETADAEAAEIPATPEPLTGGADIFAPAENTANAPPSAPPHDDATPMPQFLQESARGAHTPNRRVRNFLTWLFDGQKKQPPAPLADVVSEVPIEVATDSVADIPMPDRAVEPPLAETASATDMAASLQVDDGQAATSMSGGEADVELQPLAKKPRTARKPTTEAAALPAQPQPDSVASAPPMQTVMQSVDNPSAGFDQEQLDIPAFLRR